MGRGRLEGLTRLCGAYYFGSVPAAGSCQATDDLSGPGACYAVTMTAKDGSTISANFKLK